MAQHTALIFGASGISGWATARELLRYPTPSTFSRVIALSNRPLARNDILFEDHRLELVSGIDLTKPVETVVRALREKVPKVDEVTHIYWYAYVHAPTDSTITEANGKLLDTTLHALREATPRLVHFIWQTGSKYYGLEFAGQAGVPPGPFKEDAPRLPEPFASSIFYYKQLDIIAEHAKSSNWTWNDVRPEVIIGYAPTVNAMNMALALGVYLSLFRSVHGRGARVPLPATIAGAHALNNESPGDHLARAAVWLSLQSGEKALHGRSFNVSAASGTYAERWPALAAAWGLEGILAQREDKNPLRPSEDLAAWALEHADAWHELERAHGLRPGVLEKTGYDILFVMSLPANREFDLSALKEAGWNEEGDWLGAYKEAWARFAQAKFIPPLE